MYLLDTDVLSNLGKPKPSPALISKLATIEGMIYTSSITVGEIVYGACKSQRREYYLSKLEQVLQMLDGVLAYDREAAWQFGKLLADLERRGTTLTEPDVQIASIALVNNLTVVTGNIDHFSRIPNLKVENWLV